MKKIILVLALAMLGSSLFANVALAQNSDYPPYTREKAYQNSTQPAEPTAPVNNTFQTWLQDLANEAVAQGISPTTIQSALGQIAIDERVIEHDQNQPETTQSFAAYAAHTVNPDKIIEGREQMHLHAHLLHEISEKYGVPPEIIVALWGMESGFGRNSGGYEIVGSLATLAYEGRRTEFFRNQLLDALRILDQEHMPSSELRGSWAGAMGQCQFMPSTYLKYAVDYRNTGKRDIWKNDADVFASIANYLAAEGWQRDQTWGREVTLEKPLPETEIGLTIQRSLPEWDELGIRTAHGKRMADPQPLQASLVQPDGLDGRSFLVYDNFRALMRWNRSTYFAASIGLLADKIK